MRVILASVSWSLAILSAVGCGPASDQAPACSHAAAEGPMAIGGRVYEDHDLSDESLYAAGYQRGDRYLEGLGVRLVGAAAERQATTCHDGSFAFDDLAEGLYLVALDLPAEALATTRNQPRRLQAAVERGEVRLVTFGDSLPVVHQDLRFPELVAERLGALAEVSLANVAVEGTTSEDWLPGGRLFDERLAPELPGADLVIVSLGGNDVLYWADDKFSAGQIGDIEAEFFDYLAQVESRLLTIVHAVREINPDVDVAYLLYPDYATTDAWAEWLGPLQDYVIDLLAEGIRSIRAGLDPAERIVLIDLFAAIESRQLDLDDLLIDELHFNDAGHDLVADEVLKALGAGRVGPAPLGREQIYGVAPLP